MAGPQPHARADRGRDERRSSTSAETSEPVGSSNETVGASAPANDVEEQERRARRESLRCVQMEATATARRILRRISTPLGMPVTKPPPLPSSK